MILFLLQVSQHFDTYNTIFLIVPVLQMKSFLLKTPAPGLLRVLRKPGQYTHWVKFRIIKFWRNLQKYMVNVNLCLRKDRPPIFTISICSWREILLAIPMVCNLRLLENYWVCKCSDGKFSTPTIKGLVKLFSTFAQRVQCSLVVYLRSTGTQMLQRFDHHPRCLYCSILCINWWHCFRHVQ